MSTVIQTTPFRFNKDEISPRLRFPDLALRAYSFNLQVKGQTYIVRITYNVWTNNGQVTVMDARQNVLASNMPLIQNITGNHPNYVFSISAFDGYSLIWDISSQNFIFSSDV